jgi:hypothetical protein
MKIVGLVVVVALVLLALNFKNLVRLYKVNTLFAPDKIVHNFSNMKELLYFVDLPKSGAAHEWPVDLQDLPEKFDYHGEDLSINDILVDTSTTALVVIKDGTIVYEDYFQGTGKDDLRISWSMSKSFVSALFGVALENGDIKSLDDQVTDYVPSLKGSAYEGTTLRNVLHMASGVEFNEDYLDKKSDINRMGRALALGTSLDDFAASLKTRAFEPGSGRQYVSIDTHVISMVIRNATGQTFQQYLLDNLWSKMGPSSDAFILTDKEENAFALGGLNMTTRDYALFGELFRHQGRRGDVQIIPADWVTESTQNSAPADINAQPLGYGYQWWLPEHADGEFIAGGIYGQNIYINPKAGIVIVKNAAHLEFDDTDKVRLGHRDRNFEMFRGIAEHFTDWEKPKNP